jgi:signal transduction histidine kinase
MPASRPLLSLLFAWLPVGALMAVMVASAHGIGIGGATGLALRMVIVAALLGLAVHRFTLRLPWPHPLELRFVLAHLLACALYAVASLLLNSAFESLLQSLSRQRLAFALVLGPGLVPYLVFGAWLYVMTAGVAYAHRAAQRAAQVEALAARTQLAALRAQLHPHLLFNALHTVVQLIPVEPARAVRAAEELATLLRIASDERRDVIALREEWEFVRRYLALESLRFGDRLKIEADLPDAVLDARVPAFALQTLVENAVRHGAAPRIEPTTIRVCATRAQDMLVLQVQDDGDGVAANAAPARSGGLARLREQLDWLCGAGARLEVGSAPGRGYRIELRLPQAALRAIGDERDDN